MGINTVDGVGWWDGVVGVSVGWLGWWGGGLMGGWVQPYPLSNILFSIKIR